MSKLRFILSFAALVLVASAAVSCGAGQGQSQLQSMTVSPATADAQSFPDGEVPFVATGNYVHPSRAVTPQPASWVACQKGLPTTDVAVTSMGVAKCATGVPGAYAINAWDPASIGPGTYNCTGNTACGGGCTVIGTAQLTCP
jgi:hypothetical protein